MASAAQSDVRVRFAPSPTGALHIGGVRAALFNWLYARNQGGKFLIRIEDTDKERSRDEHTQDIMAAMKWLGMESDEEVVYQSANEELHKQQIQKLLDSGHAYRCYATEEELNEMREVAMKKGEKPRYDRRWRDRTDYPEGKPYCIRAKLPLDGKIGFDDQVYGRIEVSNEELDDFVILRTSGVPTYNFSVVCDDGEMNISHVIRGDDHINNTVKQLHLFDWLGYRLPVFAHLPMVLGQDKKKLSKRQGDVSANSFRDAGYMSEAVLNFLARLGWSHGDQELFTVDELIKFFSFDNVQKSGAVFNHEKLDWINGEQMRRAGGEKVRDLLVRDFASEFGEDLERMKTAQGARVVEMCLEKAKTLKELAELIAPIVSKAEFNLDISLLKGWSKKPESKAPAQQAIQGWLDRMDAKLKDGAEDVWQSGPSLANSGLSVEQIEGDLKEFSKEQGLKVGEMMQPVRLALVGKLAGPGVGDLMAVLPWTMVRARLEAIAKA